MTGQNWQAASSSAQPRTSSLMIGDYCLKSSLLQFEHHRGVWWSIVGYLGVLWSTMEHRGPPWSMILRASECIERALRVPFESEKMQMWKFGEHCVSCFTSVEVDPHYRNVRRCWTMCCMPLNEQVQWRGNATDDVSDTTSHTGSVLHTLCGRHFPVAIMKLMNTALLKHAASCCQGKQCRVWF